MSAFKPAYGYYGSNPRLKRRVRFGAYLSNFMGYCYSGLNNRQLWLGVATRSYRGFWLGLVGLYCAILVYAVSLAVEMPNSEWARLWLWPASDVVGLTIKTIEIQGHRQDSEVALKAAAQVETGAPIFTVDVQSIQSRISQLPGVKFASVQTLLPDTVRIQVEEREPFAIWQRNGRWAVVDDAGEVITHSPDDRYKSLPQIVGLGAEKHAPAFFLELERFPDVVKRVRAAVFVAERRWNLHLEDSVDVKLPETGVREVLAEFDRLSREHAITDKDIMTIDLRSPDRIVVRLSDDAAQKRQEFIRSKFSKKAGKPT